MYINQNTFVKRHKSRANRRRMMSFVFWWDVFNYALNMFIKTEAYGSCLTHCLCTGLVAWFALQHCLPTLLKNRFRQLYAILIFFNFCFVTLCAFVFVSFVGILCFCLLIAFCYIFISVDDNFTVALWLSFVFWCAYSWSSGITIFTSRLWWYTFRIAEWTKTFITDSWL